MHLNINMGKHNVWRKIAKRERRRKLRMKKAKERDSILQDAEKNEELEMFEIEHIEKLNEIENMKWLQAERNALKQWQRLQEKKEILRQKHLEHEAKLKQEWELEQQRKKVEEEKLKEIQEQNKKKQEIFLQHLEKFLAGDSSEPPEELLVSRETRPNMESCPFFSKTGCCRFGDQCSRNHKYPGISKVLLAPKFYVHFGLSNSAPSEYDTDVMLEYEDNETYKEYKDFFYDVVTEFEKFGKIIQFKVCNNYEKHLRGNTYIEYEKLRCAVAAYRSLNTRWYGGRQLSLQFCLINSWKNAICGLQLRRRCPKGRACNFLHVFRNPNNMFCRFDNRIQETDRNRPQSERWRWSESPEPETPRRSFSRVIETRKRKEQIKRDRKSEGRNSRDRKDKKRRNSEKCDKRNC